MFHFLVPTCMLFLWQVQQTDSLASIAARFGTTTSVLKSLNRLMSDLVYPGQVATACVIQWQDSHASC